jgi:hypothetical protein
MNGHELIALREWERAQDNGVDGGEDSGVGADPEGEGEDDGGGEAGSFAEKAKGGTSIGARGFEQSGDVDLAELLGDLLAAAEVDTGLTVGLVRRHARGFVLTGESVDVERDFAV